MVSRLQDGLQRRKPCQQSVGECCQLLVAEGYCTDPHMRAKLMSIINKQQ